MSCNYADGLSPYENKGRLGLPEIIEEPNAIDLKIEKLAEWMKEAKHIVVHTGAGISTAAGIPDFRGPNGVWTLEEKGLKPDINISFDYAVPTKTHMILASLAEAGIVKFVVSQNIDGLHLKSGLKRTSISELHGNMFVAQCNTCEKQFIQGQSVPTVGQKEIGLPCPWVKYGGRGCRGKLKDSILDWEHNLPEKDLEAADIHSTLSDLSICLGTTLQIVPAGTLPLKAKKNPGGKFVVVNLQTTEHYKKADLIIHARVDLVLERIAEILKVEVRPYSESSDPAVLMRKNAKLFIDWTLSSAFVSKLKKIMALRGNKNKKTIQRRKKKRRSSSSSEEEVTTITKRQKFTPKPEPLIPSIPPIPSANDLQIPNHETKEVKEVKIEPEIKVEEVPKPILEF